MPATLERPDPVASPGASVRAPRRRLASESSRAPLLVVVLVAIAATLPLWNPGALAGHSAWFDLVRLFVFDAAVRAGDWFPTWTPEFYHGYGSPLFQFYAPLTYYAAECAVLAGFDLASALKLTQGLALLASGLAMYRFATPRLCSWAAALAATLYMLAPYRLVDIYVRHALAEHCAFVWLPLIAWGAERFVAERSRGGLITAALATAALVLTHNIMALIGLPLCVLAGALTGGGLRRWPLAAIPAGLGVALATFFWWPALAARSITHGPEALTDGYFDVFQNFATLPRLLSTAWGFGASTESGPDAMSLQIGVVPLGAVLVALVLLCARGKADASRPWLAVGAVIAVLAAAMCHPLSAPVWRALPLLDYVQFPWRFLGLVVFGAALCAGATADRLATLLAGRTWLVPVAGVAATVLASAPFCREPFFLAVNPASAELQRLPAETLRAGLTDGVLVPVAAVLDAEAIRGSGQRATSDDDFLPRGVRVKPAALADSLVAVSAGRVEAVQQLAPNHYRAQLTLPEPATIELRQFWFPGWVAELDGAPLALSPRGPAALVAAEAPAGEHVVTFRYTQLPQRRVGLLVTALALGALVWAALFLPPAQRSAA